jgi:quinol monooxygenase YgiN
MIHVVAVITAKEGMRGRILEAYRANLEAVRAEAGCIEYGAVIDSSQEGAGAFAQFGKDTFVVVEKWASMDALRAHGAAPHMKAYGSQVKDFIANRAIHVLDAV